MFSFRDVQNALNSPQVQKQAAKLLKYMGDTLTSLQDSKKMEAKIEELGDILILQYFNLTNIYLFLLAFDFNTLVTSNLYIRSNTC